MLNNIKPYFSIIIPTLNEEDFLPKLLIDLTKQTEQNFEVIISDGVSEDKTKNVAMSFYSRLPMSIIQTEKRRPSCQRNLGARRAVGKYLIFLDADLRLTRSFTKKLYNKIQKKPGLVYIPCNIPDENSLEAKTFFQLATLIVEFSQMVGKPISTGGSMVVEKNFFNLIDGYPEDVALSEDHQFVQRVYDWGVKSHILPDITIRFSLRRMRKEGKLRLFIKVARMYASYMLKGKITSDNVGYPMGGHLYNKKEFSLDKQRKKILFNAKKVFEDSKTFFHKILIED